MYIKLLSRNCKIMFGNIHHPFVTFNTGPCIVVTRNEKKKQAEITVSSANWKQYITFALVLCSKRQRLFFTDLCITNFTRNDKKWQKSPFKIDCKQYVDSLCLKKKKEKAFCLPFALHLAAIVRCSATLFHPE